jgi:integrase
VYSRFCFAVSIAISCRRRTRIAAPVEALTLINNAPAEDRALWATAFYAGLRRGELQALTWDGVDLAAGLISVECSWDQKQGPVEPKSAAGFRRTPIAAVLRDYLVQHRVTQDKDKRALVFGLTDGAPFSPSTVAQRAERAWRAGGLEPVTLHECRHTFATLMIAAGVNAKAAPDVHGPLVDHGHARPLRTPVPRLRRASCAPARRLPQGCPRACTQG